MRAAGSVGNARIKMCIYIKYDCIRGDFMYGVRQGMFYYEDSDH